MTTTTLYEDVTPVEMEKLDVSGFHLTGHNLLLRPLYIQAKTKGNILMASRTQHDIAYLMNVCEVVMVGPTAYTQDIFKNAKGEVVAWCKEGDYVLLPRLVGQKIKYKGVPLTLVACDKVIAVLDDPNDIDSNFNISSSASM